MISASRVMYHEIPFGVNVNLEEEKIFSIFDSQLRFMSYPNRWQTAVTFEFWDTMKVYHRIDYGLLDWLSDIGGLYNILALIFFMFLGRYLSNGTSLFVASELISEEKIDEEIKRSLKSASLKQEGDSSDETQ